MIRFTLKETPSVPLEAEVLSPDALVSLAADQIRALPVLLGKRRRRLDEFFEVEAIRAPSSRSGATRSGSSGSVAV